jgi:hypothetical protein
MEGLEAAVSDGLNGMGSIYLDMNGFARPWQCKTKTQSPTIMRNIVMDDQVKKARLHVLEPFHD